MLRRSLTRVSDGFGNLGKAALRFFLLFAVDPNELLTMRVRLLKLVVPRDACLTIFG